MIGEVLGNYRVCGQIGEGGMGVVYSAEHHMLGSKAAIKLLLPELSSNPQIVERFFNEAKAAATINHPGLITVFDFGYHQGGSAYIVMEFLDGESLASRLKRSRPELAFVAEFARQVTLALGAAHAHQIVHRDLKPDNLFLCPDPALPLGVRAKILDFGIAKLSGDSSSSVKTRTGCMMGTPTYMAPEQCRGAGLVDARADIYALGCILFEMLTGRPPFEAEGVGEIIGKHMYEAPPSLRDLRPELSAQLTQVVDRALSKDPADRQQSMQELGDELARAFGTVLSSPTSQPPVSEDKPRDSSSRVNPITTLGGAAAASATTGDAQRPRRGFLAASVGALAVAAIGSAILLAGQKRGAPAAPPLAKNAAVSMDAGPSPADAAVLAAEVDAAAGTQDILAALALPPDDVNLRIESTPPGADVYRVLDQVRVGKTPYEFKIQPVAGELVFMLKLKGYKNAEVVLAADGDHTEQVTLSPLGKRPARDTRPARPEGRALDPFGRSQPLKE